MKGEADVFQGDLRGRELHLEGRATYALHGELDLANCAEVIARLRALAGDHGARLDLDLGELGYIDSSGLSAVIELHRALAASGGGLRVVAVSPIVARLLEVTEARVALDLPAPDRGAAD